MYVCICNAITEAELRHSVNNGARSLEDLQLDTGVASCCGTCADAAQAVLARHCPGAAACHAAPAAVAVAPVAMPSPVMRAPSVPSAPVFAPVRWVSRAPHAMAKAA